MSAVDNIVGGAKKEKYYCVILLKEELCALVRHGGSTESHFHRKVCQTQGDVELVDNPGGLPDIICVCRDLVAFRSE